MRPGEMLMIETEEQYAEKLKEERALSGFSILGDEYEPWEARCPIHNTPKTETRPVIRIDGAVYMMREPHMVHFCKLCAAQVANICSVEPHFVVMYMFRHVFKLWDEGSDLPHSFEFVGEAETRDDYKAILQELISDD